MIKILCGDFSESITHPYHEHIFSSQIGSRCALQHIWHDVILEEVSRDGHALLFFRSSVDPMTPLDSQKPLR